MTIFWTADLHLSHANILKYCNRPFKTIDEMDDYLVKRIIELVKPGDTLYVLGDISLNTKTFDWFVGLMKQYNIKLITIQGNHDARTCDHQILIKDIEDITVVMCHYPFARWYKSHNGSWNCHGHEHGRYKGQGKQYDVGVDNNDYKPVSWQQLKKIMKGKPNNEDLIG